MPSAFPGPLFIGYFPKKTAGKSEWFDGSPVEEVCSVCNCMSAAPPDWISAWKHNAWGLYDAEPTAWDIIQDDPGAYDMYAYKLYPFVFDGSEGRTLSFERTATEQLAAYEFLGYDPVSRAEPFTQEFGHSPLSCNKGHEKYHVNRFSLLDNLEDAWRIASEVAKEAKEQGSWEPGPYYLCEVYRKRSRP